MKSFPGIGLILLERVRDMDGAVGHRSKGRPLPLFAGSDLNHVKARMKHFSLVMSLVYVLFGCLFLFTEMLNAQITRFRIPIGLVLVAYGIARAYLWQRRYNEDQEGS